MMKYLVLLFFAITFFSKSHSQIKPGAWRDHLSYHYCQSILKTKDKVFCAPQTGLFSYSLIDNSLQKYTTVQGLSDVTVSSIAYSEKYDLLFVAYLNSNIDILHENSVIYVSDIYKKQISGGKRINQIVFHDNFAWLATDFGIVLYDMQRREFGDTYYFTPDGSTIKINSISFTESHVYAATQVGIFKADLNSDFLIDFSSWSKLDFIPKPDLNYNSVYTLKNRVYAFSSESSNIKNILIIDDSNSYEEKTINEDFLNFKIYNESLIFICPHQVLIYNDSFRLLDKVDRYGYYSPNPSDAIVFDDEIWIADCMTGVAHVKSGVLEQVLVDSPRYPSAQSMICVDGKLWVAGASKLSENWNYNGAYLFQDESWTNFNGFIFPLLTDVANISSVAVNPKATNQVFLGTWGYGVVQIADNKVVNVFDETNSILKNIDGYTHDYIRVAGLAFDSESYLWLALSGVDNPVYRISPDGVFAHINVSNNLLTSARDVNNFFITSGNIKWLSLKNNGLIVFDDKSNQNHFLIRSSEGELLSTDVWCLAEDLDGSVWMGTSNGIVEYFSVSNILSGNNFYASRPLVTSSDVANYFLKGQQVTAIAVDGANRKWVGTANSGIFLMNDNCTEEILHFTADNSPLFSNSITSIAIDDKSGEVFIGTDKGLISYKGNSTKSNDTFGDVYVYPNPVKPTYTGDIFINGMVRDASVKITDINGNLVYHTTSLGGKAVWNGCDFNGRRVNSGVYLVFCANDDGSDSIVTKLLFIN